MPITYKTKESGAGGDTNYAGLANKSVIVRFIGFKRGDDGHIKVDNMLKWHYTDDGGVVKNAEGNLVANPKDGYQDVMYYRFEVVRVAGKEEANPWEFMDIQMQHRVNENGIVITGPEEFEWYLRGQMSSLIRTAIACGLSPLKADKDSTFFDDAYLRPYLENLTAPLTVPKIVEHVIEPILLAAAMPTEDKPPLLVQAKTVQNPGSNFVGFKWDSFEGLDADMCAMVWVEKEKRGQVPLDPPSTEPFPEDEKAEPAPTPVVYETGLDDEAMRDAIATAVLTPDKAQGHVVPADMNENKKARLAWLYDQAMIAEPTFSGRGKILSEIKSESLLPLYCLIYPKPEEEVGL